MTVKLGGAVMMAALALGGAAGGAVAQGAKAPMAMLPGAGSHEPINIAAGKLDYFDKDQKLVYSGDVVAVQGDSTLKASQLVIFLTKTDPKGAPAAGGEAAAATAAAGGPGAPGRPSGRSWSGK